MLSSPPPLVSIIVPHHLNENDEYLTLCLESLRASEEIPFEILCISDAPNAPERILDQRLRFYHDRSLVLASDKFNWAARNTHAASQYLWFVSDDVMVTPRTLSTLVYGLNENRIIVNPMSNSDNGSQFFTDLGIPVKCSKEDLPLFDIPKSNGIPFLIPVRQFISFYCTMISKKIWEEVGELDPRMDYRHNDQDWCLRALKLGIQPMINLGAFALHFGDKTILRCTTEEQRNDCSKVFAEKWNLT